MWRAPQWLRIAVAFAGLAVIGGELAAHVAHGRSTDALLIGAAIVMVGLSPVGTDRGSG